MHIVCPNCTTSYAVDPRTFGDFGRTVRCSRCKEVWLAYPKRLERAEAMAGAMAANHAAVPAGAISARAVIDSDARDTDTPLIDSPPIAGEWPAAAQNETVTTAPIRPDHAIGKRPTKSRRSLLSRLKPMAARIRWMPRISLTTGCAGMAALILALMIWRVDVVRLLPQTAAFYKIAGLNVNLRALAFKDVKVVTETANGKPVLVIEGVIIGESRKPVKLPRLRFIVRDAQGTEIYAWNAVLEQPVLNPGEKAWFRSKLASPPADARQIDVRFFSKRDDGAKAT